MKSTTGGGMRDDEAARIATTEALFREVNERIAESAERFDAHETEFVCECGDPSCSHRLQADLAEYERVRADPTRFLLVPGHDDERVERVVAVRRGYAIVEKVHAAVAATARRLDPRAGAA